MKLRVVCSIIGLILIACSIYAFTSPERQDFYSGKITFNTEAPYTEFKNAIGANSVEIRKITALSSSPPIVVDFEVGVPHNYDFGYGDISHPDIANRILTTALLSGAGIILLWTLGIQRPRVWFLFLSE